jgi:predicted nucleic acid-binding protein
MTTKKTMNKYIFDSNVYDYLLDNNADIEKIKISGDYYSTNVQYSR